MHYQKWIKVETYLLLATSLASGLGLGKALKSKKCTRVIFNRLKTLEEEWVKFRIIYYHHTLLNNKNACHCYVNAIREREYFPWAIFQAMYKNQNLIKKFLEDLLPSKMKIYCSYRYFSFLPSLLYASLFLLHWLLYHIHLKTKGSPKNEQLCLKFYIYRQCFWFVMRSEFNFINKHKYLPSETWSSSDPRFLLFLLSILRSANLPSVDSGLRSFLSI